MMKLFGDFSETVFATYQELIPMFPDLENRDSLRQLYCLLARLNIFGESYCPQVETILKHYD